MFQTLMDAETGFAINNKFSIRIYNDPLSYMAFLKVRRQGRRAPPASSVDRYITSLSLVTLTPQTSISALIDAGAIPDNERVNQPKRGKTCTVENREVRRGARLPPSSDNALMAGPLLPILLPSTAGNRRVRDDSTHANRPAGRGEQRRRQADGVADHGVLAAARQGVRLWTPCSSPTPRHRSPSFYLRRGLPPPHTPPFLTYVRLSRA